MASEPLSKSTVDTTAELPARRTLNAEPSQIVRELTRVDAKHAADEPRHRWYFFKEAFSPSVVQSAMDDCDCTKGDLVVDPFSGSGTVPLSAAAAGLRTYGCEVNPFLALVARAKLHTVKPDSVRARLSELIAGIRSEPRSPLEGFSTFSPRDGLGKWLFNTSVLRAFEGGWRASGERESPVRDLVRLCLLGAALDTCNATKDGKCLRYRKDWEQKNFGLPDFIEAFEERMEQVYVDLAELPLPVSGTVEVGDAREMTLAEPFRLCVTSPPYLNSFDYTDVYRPELFLGRFVTDMRELAKLRMRTIRSHVQVDWPRATHTNFGGHYLDSVDRLRPHEAGLWDRRIPAMVQAYFEDMRVVLTRLRAAAADNGSAWIVVSTSAYAGVEIPVDLIIADIASSVRWHVREVSPLRYLGRVAVQQWDALSSQKSNKPHLRESVIILDATPRLSML